MLSCVCLCGECPARPCKPGCTYLAQPQTKQKETWGFTTTLFVPEPHVTCSDTRGQTGPPQPMTDPNTPLTIPLNAEEPLNEDDARSHAI